jgi:hypothetical protein
MLGQIKLVDSREEDQGQEWPTSLATALLGGDRIISTGSTIVAKLQTFSYDGDRKNFNFDKYVTLHIEQHNLHADLTKYGVTPLDKSFTILWFQNGIKCSALDAVKASINANKALSLLNSTPLKTLMWTLSKL